MSEKLFSEIPHIESGNIVLRKVTMEDKSFVKEMTENPNVYKYLPTFLFEKKYEDTEYVIRHLYNECFKESIILGIYYNRTFCGLAELYGYRDEIHKVSVGYRLMEEYWGRGIATKTLSLLVNYLYGKTDIEIITASTLPANKASARVLEKNGFELVVHNSPEDWGYEKPLPTDKWIR